MTEFSRKIQLYTAFITYFLSGFFIFTPLFDSDCTPPSFLISTAISIIVFELSLFFFSRENKTKRNNGSVFYHTLCFLCVLLGVFCSLILITQVIHDISYSTGRYISSFYYVCSCLVLLFISFYSCLGKEKGIFRFCSVCSLAFLIIIPVCYFCFFSTTLTFSTFPLISDNSTLYLQIKSGVFSGMMLSCDICVFLYAFSDFISNVKKAKKHLRIAFAICTFLIFSFCVCTLLAFGQELTFGISNIPFSLIKLVPGIDLTELLSAVKIISFTVKSSLYICSTSKSIEKSFKASKKKAYFLSSLIQYLLIPIIFIPFSVVPDILPYGALQKYIYPLSFLFGILTLITKYFY